ncbi:hypothetical protein [Hymenobacter negativus]|uniref:DUF3298 domain-containing protein n=1 Tax=Hymenobacter negativus TaxID=2795026 RepID=A0ABS3QDT4_9BACT|nr:hypothetical protein [Hymenobacter negativus]MBO2009143.1 hypothetical protein [Hymenobacter negativus]
MKRTRAGWQLAGGLLLVAALASCQPERPKKEPARMATKPEPAQPRAGQLQEASYPDTSVTVTPTPVVAAEPEETLKCPSQQSGFVSNPALRRRWVVRRYVGTIGGQAATAVLQWQNPDSITGSFYMHRGSREKDLFFYRKHPGQVVLEVGAEDSQSQWRLSSAISTMLAGTWQGDGHSQRIVMRESYAQAVRYTFKPLLLVGSGLASYHCEQPWERHNFLVVLSPPAGRAALRRRLAPSLAARHRQIQADYQGDCKMWYEDQVRLNDFDLLSYQTSYTENPIGGTVSDGTTSWLVDLRTSKFLTIASQLQPGYALPLRRLLSKHLLHDEQFADYTSDNRWEWHDARQNPSQLVSLPDIGEDDGGALTLTVDGLEATYGSQMLRRWGTSVIIPYRELRPLVRPGTPLARMLAARRM